MQDLDARGRQAMSTDAQKLIDTVYYDITPSAASTRKAMISLLGPLSSDDMLCKLREANWSL